MAVILSLFSDSEMKGMAPMPAARSLSVSAGPADAAECLGASRLNPCTQCSLRGLCDPDECAAKQYPIDAPFAFTLFPNLGVYIQFLKSHGWL